MAAQAIVDSAIAFCENSLAIREYLDTAVTTPGSPYVTLDIPTGCEVARMMDVCVGGRLLAPLSFDTGERAAATNSQGLPRMYYVQRLDGDTRLVLLPSATSAEKVTVTCATKPLRNATVVHDELFERWLDVIVDGALGRLYALPDQPFSDAAKAQQRAAQTFFGTSSARRESFFNRVRAANSVRIRPFA